MVNYEYGKIYKLYSKQQNITYIGSTAQYYLSRRMDNHKKHYKSYLNGKYPYVTSFKILECDDYKYELIEEYPCNNVQQLKTRERYYIENNECVNKYIPGRTKKEWGQDNKDKIKANKSELITCECGCDITKNHLLRHKTTPKHIKLVQNKL